MTSQAFQDPKSIRHFQSICDACQQLIHTFHTPAELKIYADGYLHALRKERSLSPKDQEKLEKLVETWILDPSSFIGPDGDINNLYFQKQK
ncbi:MULTISPECIES: DUF6761 family protein [Prochlorococcus]|uniref:Uncharacterized protein n=1 Tax=Prochlorococcus marinus (strain SARG / CCMP1375 / SS120) TaxID=167539 RepID=Q7VBK8_PROMA|nr:MULTISPECIES: DUF6761 family protein [Prochlorococcus]AAQ00129.1 Uncharacterized protein Pro_1084 [Prochlorococcus marinus subsp. marinus str. CCMP1375]KGG13925.1 hypothetical protein EV04_0410 [Prochlorococcus marinus str. LG]KGG19058.1 hypothetical protein EV08_1545 [Prochlorococcus marinus str. SS2]KGG23402.1 hypothetical protein EV09_1026 [Prochlorococcus marinus str. SS35]KGG32362.1 hypothetical protein EV10_1477 [Prochlorococcus marinus str. SS51]